MPTVVCILRFINKIIACPVELSMKIRAIASVLSCFVYCCVCPSLSVFLCVSLQVPCVDLLSSVGGGVSLFF